jgi:hypothetical protein
MRLLLLACIAALWAAPVTAQAPPAAPPAPTYLNDEAVWAKGWSELVDKLGANPDVAEILIRPDAIEVLARAEAGGSRLDRWRVTSMSILTVRLHRVSGPRPEQPSSPVGNVESGFFKLSSVPIDRLWSILDTAKGRVRLDDPGRIASVRIARQVSLLPTPSHGDVRWSIAITNDRESASVIANADGGVMGVDIAGTNRGRNRNFLEQDEWPLGDAQASFRSMVASRPEVYELDISRTSIKMTAVSRASPTAVTAWLWDGGTFRRDFIDSPNIELVRSNGNLPFSLDEVDLSKAPAALKAAREKEPSGHPRIMIAKAVKERAAVGAPRVLWEVQMVDARRQIPLVGEDFAERTIVKVTPQGEVVSVLLPKSLRPVVNPYGSGAVLAAISRFTAAYGPQTRVVELSFRGRGATIKMQTPSGPREVELDERGIREGSAMMAGMPSMSRATFTLGDLAKMNAATIDSMVSRAQAAVPLPGAVVHGVRFWSGEPFWRPRAGLAHVDIRVGVPPRHDVGGYVVFTTDGKHVETVK